MIDAGLWGRGWGGVGTDEGVGHLADTNMLDMDHDEERCRILVSDEN